MNKQELILYEAPSISEWISWSWLQTIIAKYIAWKVNRKWDRYQNRIIRAEYFKSLAQP